MIDLKKLTTVAVLGGGLLLAGCGSQTVAAGSSGVKTHTATPASTVVHQTMVITTGGKGYNPDWPRFTNAFWTAKKGDTVVLTIKSYDDGAAPVAKALAAVQGTVGNTELVDGKSVTAVAMSQVSHTFTVPGLGINIPIPTAPHNGYVTVQATLHVTKAGTFEWQCMAPCGTGSDGWQGPMAKPSYMIGTVTINA